MSIEIPLHGDQPRLELHLLDTALAVEPSTDGQARARFETAGSAAAAGAGAAAEAGAEPDSDSDADTAAADAAAHMAERFEVTSVEREDGRMVTRLSEQRLSGAPRGRLTVSVPADPAPRLEVRNRNGRVSVRELRGAIGVRTRNGAIRVAECTGRLRVAAANGSVQIHQVEAPRLEASTSNGRITVLDSRVGGGAVRSANGRIRLQVAPLPMTAADVAAAASAADADAEDEHAAGVADAAAEQVTIRVDVDGEATDTESSVDTDADATDAAADAETGARAATGAARGQRLVVHSANGRVSLALPDDVNATVKVRTRGSLRNHREAASTQTARGVTTFQLQGAESAPADAQPMLFLINNLRGGVDLLRYADIDAQDAGDEYVEEDEFVFTDEPHDHEFFFDLDFGEELPRFMKDVQKFGMKFGRLGEEVSREMRRAFRFGPGGRRHDRSAGHGEHHQHHADQSEEAETQRADTSEEIRTVLDLLRDGKVSVDEAERLIAALRR